MNFLPGIRHLKLLLRMLRLPQWLKNLMLFFPPFLGGAMGQPGTFVKGIGPFFVFCLASSSTYIFNDIMDRENDSCHPKKKLRPIPSGAIAPVTAGILAVVLLIISLVWSLQYSLNFSLILLAYLIISFSYSTYLKHFPVIDIFCISAGFLLRLHAGGEVFNIPISQWLFLSVFLLSIFLSTGKRLCEKDSLGAEAAFHRKTLDTYPEGFLEGVMYMTGAAVLVTYAMYVLPHKNLLYSVPLCTFGLLRYILRVKSGKGGDPTDSLLKDRSLFIVGLLWSILVGYSIYAK
jgi:decaprenyl-phosphate phosphoribosyltransferase